jgi:ATP-binding cassette subfamily D (ALD) protein 3
MPATLSKIATAVRSNPRLSATVAAVSAGVLLYTALKSLKRRDNGRKGSVDEDVVAAMLAEKKKLEQKKSETRASVNTEFVRRLGKLMKILFPSVLIPETGYVLLVAVMLVLRTFCDVWMIQNGTAVEASIIGRSSAGFKDNVLQFVIAMPMIALVNNFLKYGLNELKLRFRTRLSLHLYEQYLTGFTYYQMSNLDNRIANADQLLTQDVEKFCDMLTELYSNLSKPLLDSCIYIYQLSGNIGPLGPLIMLGYLAVSGAILTRLRAPIGRMTVKEQELEGELRYVNSRIITNSEEIAFYVGNKREKLTLKETFNRLVRHLRRFLHFRVTMGFADNIIAKYLATVVGYYVVSRPFLQLGNTMFEGKSHNDRLKHYYKSGRMLVRLAEAMGRLLLAGREMTRLAGYTARTDELMAVLQDLRKGHYQRAMVNKNRDEQDQGLGLGVPLVPGTGEVVVQDRIIRFEQVPLVTPNGDVLVQELNFEVKSGMNVLVCGPNGCGKSSLFRILGELWPLFGGRLIKPDRSKLFYIPQRPYMTIGTLRDQVIYPDSVTDLKRKGLGDDFIRQIIEKVQLAYLVDRDGGWDAIEDWMDVLSGGEKQRIAMARLFYHEPQFAILDECTSAVSVDVESFIYQHCKQKGISLFTVSHRKSLWVHHEYVLRFDGRGNYEYKKMEDCEEEFGS